MSRREKDLMRRLVAANQAVDPAEVDMSKVEEIYFLQSSHFDAMMDEVNTQFGSIDTYLRDGLGLSESQLTQLRANLLD